MRTKKKLWILFIIIIAAAGLLVCIRVKKGTSVTSLDSNITSNVLVRGGDGDNIYSMDVNKTGIFFVEDYVMKYCDYEAAETYVLCGRANCLHADSGCGAFVGNAAGLGQWNGKIYAFLLDTVKNRYELTEMSLTGQDRRVITTLEIGEYQVGNWVLTDLSYDNKDIYYGYGKAFVSLEYSLVGNAESGYANNLSRQELLIIDLETGKTEKIAESVCYDLFHTLEFQLIDGDSAIYVLEEAPDALTGDDLMEAIENGTISGLEEMYEAVPEEDRQDIWEDDLYSFYLDYAVYRMVEKTSVIYRYDMGTGESMELCRGGNAPWRIVLMMEKSTAGIPFTSAWAGMMTVLLCTRRCMMRKAGCRGLNFFYGTGLPGWNP